MGNNLGKKKMKKMFLFLVSLFCISMTVNAQDASGSCKLPGTYDYVNVDFYAGSPNLSGKGAGTLRISNQSALPITNVRIKVTVAVSALELGTNDKCEYEKTIYDNTVYGIAAYESGKAISVDYDLTKGRAQNPRIKSINVSVSNPICKQSN